MTTSRPLDAFVQAPPVTPSASNDQPAPEADGRQALPSILPAQPCPDCGAGYYWENAYDSQSRHCAMCCEPPVQAMAKRWWLVVVEPSGDYGWEPAGSQRRGSSDDHQEPAEVFTFQGQTWRADRKPDGGEVLRRMDCNRWWEKCRTITNIDEHRRGMREMISWTKRAQERIRMAAEAASVRAEERRRKKAKRAAKLRGI